MPRPSANIPTPSPANPASAFPVGIQHTEDFPFVHIRANSQTRHSERSLRSEESRLTSSIFRKLAPLVAFSLILFFVLSAPAQPTPHKKKKPTPPKSPACLDGCKPVISSPALDNATPEDAAAQNEPAPLARNLYLGTPGSYEKMVAFANKNASSVWGQRAALALGYEEYSKTRAAQAMPWLEKAKADSRLLEYTLFWTAQTEHALNRNTDAARDFAAILKDYPATAVKEPLLEAYVPVLLANGRAQDALDALAAYAPTGSKPALLLARAHANEAAHKFVPAAKDYQALYYKFPLADEAKEAAIALPRLNK